MSDDPIDPRLQQYAQSLPPHTLAQAYTAGPALANNAGHQPYYLPTPTQTQTQAHHQHPHANLNAHAHPPPLAPAAPPSALDPALEPSPIDHHATSPDDEDEDQEGDHDGYVAACCAPITHHTLRFILTVGRQCPRNTRICQIAWRLEAAARLRLLSRPEGAIGVRSSPKELFIDTL